MDCSVCTVVLFKKQRQNGALNLQCTATVEKKMGICLKYYVKANIFLLTLDLILPLIKNTKIKVEDAKKCGLNSYILLDFILLIFYIKATGEKWMKRKLEIRPSDHHLFVYFLMNEINILAFVVLKPLFQLSK